MSIVQNPSPEAHINPPFINADAIQWQPVGGDECNDITRLLAHIIICGVNMHLEAIAISVDAEGLQVSRTGHYDEDLNNLALATGADDHWQTAEIYGHEYVIFASPFC
jgi:hypothetical protein